MFDVGALAAVDPHADEAALIGQIAELEAVKSAGGGRSGPGGRGAGRQAARLGGRCRGAGTPAWPRGGQ